MKAYSLALFLLSAGCIANDCLGTAATAENNIYKLSNVALGMSESEVLRIMRLPYSEERIQIGNDVYDIWFYVTRMTALGQSRMVPQNVTPLTFKNGVLIAWGFAYYNALVQRVEVHQKIEPAPSPPEEDVPLEKALKAPPLPEKTAPSSPPLKDQPGTKGMVSMSKRPDPKEEEPPSDEGPLDDKDRKMIEEENEENFNFW